jgi:hypothetical protein
MRYTWIHAINEPRNFSFKYPKDISIAFDKFKTSCVAIVVPKSSIGAFVNNEGEVFYFRDWKMGNLDSMNPCVSH